MNWFEFTTLFILSGIVTTMALVFLAIFLEVLFGVRIGIGKKPKVKRSVDNKTRKPHPLPR